MPKPLALCLEDLDTVDEQGSFLQCTALVGRGPGLVITKAGVSWSEEGAVGCELWVSADDRLILYRQEGAERATVTRAGRSLDVPAAKPVVIVDKDELEVGERHLRVHVHGFTARVAAPSPLAPRRTGGAGRVAAAVALSAALAGGCGGTVEVREEPPSESVIVEPVQTPTPPPEQAQPVEIRETPPDMPAPETPPPPPIEVREDPPDMLEE